MPVSAKTRPGYGKTVARRASNDGSGTRSATEEAESTGLIEGKAGYP